MCMARGRKHRAIEVSEASGRFVKDPQCRPTNIIKASTGHPDPPELVRNCKASMACWEQTCGILHDSGILSSSDENLITRYVLTYVEWVKVAAYIQKHGHSDDNGKTSPESVAFFKLSSEHNKLVGELGLSPSSRARLSVATSDPTDTKSKSDLKAYLKALKND